MTKNESVFAPLSRKYQVPIRISPRTATHPRAFSPGCMPYSCKQAADQQANLRENSRGNDKPVDLHQNQPGQMMPMSVEINAISAAPAEVSISIPSRTGTPNSFSIHLPNTAALTSSTAVVIRTAHRTVTGEPNRDGSSRAADEGARNHLGNIFCRAWDVPAWNTAVSTAAAMTAPIIIPAGTRFR